MKSLNNFIALCRKNRNSKNPRVAKTNKEKQMLILKCVICDSRKLRVIRKREISGLLSNLELKTPATITLSFVDIFF